MKGLEGKVSEHPDLFKVLENIVNLFLADSCPSSSPPIYLEGSLSVFSISLTYLRKLYRDKFVFQWKIIPCLHTTHTSGLSDSSPVPRL